MYFEGKTLQYLFDERAGHPAFLLLQMVKSPAPSHEFANGQSDRE